MLSNKKGQVTIFVILAIVIIVIVGIVIYVRGQVVSNGPLPVELTEIPNEFKPIRTYVESCLLTIANDGINKLASHGGYIYPLNKTYTKPSIFIDPANPTEADAILLANQEDAIPYWYYLKGKNTNYNFLISSLTPSIESMQTQLSLYIQDNLDSCIDFAEFEKTGITITSISIPIVDTVIYDSGQDFLLNYNFEVDNGNIKQNIQDYYVKSDLPLKKLYDIAYNITYYESLTNHMAVYTKKLISSHAGPNQESLPPLFYVSYDSHLFWVRPIVKDNIKNIIYRYSQLFQVLGTRNFNDNFIATIPENDSTIRNLYLSAIMPIYPKDNDYTKDISVDFLYHKEPSYVNVFPNKGELIYPREPKDNQKALNKYLSNDKKQYYEFFYDVSYPMIIRVKSHNPENMNNELSFNFAMEINLRKGYTINEYLLGLGPVPWGSDFLDIKILNVDTSANQVNSNILPGNKASNSIFCEPAQRTSGNISFLLFDRNSGTALSDATVSYGCGTYAECAIGRTELKMGAGYFNNKMPLCLNGYVLIESSGYQSKRIKLTTEKDRNINLGAIGLYPFETKNITIKKYPINYNFKSVLGKQIIEGVSISDSNYPLSATDSVVVKLSLIGEDIDVSHEVFLTLDGNETGEAQLVPGRYAVDISYMDNNGVIIPKECNSVCKEKRSWVLGGGCKKRVYYPSDPIEIKPAPWGGLDFNASKTISLRARDIYNKNNSLELYSLVYPLPDEVSCLNSLEEMNKKTSYTMVYRSILVPKFVSSI
jgi:hypothetical protein